MRLKGLALLALLGASAPPAAAQSAAPVGEWLTGGGDGVIAIAPCGAELCGRIVGMSQTVRPDGTRPTDPQGRPQCGLTILHAAAADTPGRWRGEITNPDDGSVWRCELWLDGSGRLHLRGYVLLPALGRTQVWTAYAGRLAPDCRME